MTASVRGLPRRVQISPSFGTSLGRGASPRVPQCQSRRHQKHAFGLLRQRVAGFRLTTCVGNSSQERDPDAPPPRSVPARELESAQGQKRLEERANALASGDKGKGSEAKSGRGVGGGRGRGESKYSCSDFESDSEAEGGGEKLQERKSEGGEGGAGRRGEGEESLRSRNAELERRIKVSAPGASTRHSSDRLVVQTSTPSRGMACIRGRGRAAFEQDSATSRPESRLLQRRVPMPHSTAGINGTCRSIARPEMAPCLAPIKR